MKVDVPIIRRMESADIPPVRQIAESLNLTNWTVHDYEDALRNKDYRMSVAENRAREIAGFLVARLIMNQDKKPIELEILNIGVKNNQQGKGIGQSLWNKFTEGIQETRYQIYLETRESNQGGISFYKKNNLQTVGSIKNYYRQPFENAVILSGQFDNSPDKKK